MKRLALLAITLVACAPPAFPRCNVKCSENACPEGYSCDPLSKRCVAPGETCTAAPDAAAADSAPAITPSELGGTDLCFGGHCPALAVPPTSLKLWLDPLPASLVSNADLLVRWRDRSDGRHDVHPTAETFPIAVQPLLDANGAHVRVPSIKNAGQGLKVTMNAGLQHFSAGAFTLLVVAGPSNGAQPDSCLAEKRGATGFSLLWRASHAGAPSNRVKATLHLAGAPPVEAVSEPLPLGTEALRLFVVRRSVERASWELRLDGAPAMTTPAPLARTGENENLFLVTCSDAAGPRNNGYRGFLAAAAAIAGEVPDGALESIERHFKTIFRIQ